MASKRYRKALRRKRVWGLHPKAAWLYFDEEDRRMYYEELAQINSDMSYDEIMLLSRMVWQNSWGRAWNEYISWQMGFTQLDFRCPQSYGKVRAKDLIVLRVNKQED